MDRILHWRWCLNPKQKETTIGSGKLFDVRGVEILDQVWWANLDTGHVLASKKWPSGHDRENPQTEQEIHVLQFLAPLTFVPDDPEKTNPVLEQMAAWREQQEKLYGGDMFRIGQFCVYLNEVWIVVSHAPENRYWLQLTRPGEKIWIRTKVDIPAGEVSNPTAEDMERGWIAWTRAGINEDVLRMLNECRREAASQ